jgi:hypothetical protein
MILAFLLVACSTSQGSAIPTLSPDEILPFDLSDYPPGWNFISLAKNYDWKAVTAYTLSFESQNLNLISHLDFMYYGDQNKAQAAFDTYKEQAFWNPGSLALSGWYTPPDLSPSLSHANENNLACIMQSRQTGEVENCTFWVRYGACLIKFHSQIGNPYMNHEEFQSIVENVIDDGMSQVSQCFDPQKI